ncbi:MAG: hypothetical protein ACREK4_11650, partial [Candidatus Rokuibacteriota bacterium]
YYTRQTTVGPEPFQEDCPLNPDATLARTPGESTSPVLASVLFGGSPLLSADNFFMDGRFFPPAALRFVPALAMSLGLNAAPAHAGEADIAPDVLDELESTICISASTWKNSVEAHAHERPSCRGAVVFRRERDVSSPRVAPQPRFDGADFALPGAPKSGARGGMSLWRSHS